MRGAISSSLCKESPTRFMKVRKPARRRVRRFATLLVTVKAPSGQPAGTYTATLQYTMLENVRLGLYATRAIGSAVLTTIVGTATVR